MKSRNLKKKQYSPKAIWYKRDESKIIAIILFVVFCLFIKCLNYGLVRDDQFHLYNNPYLQSLNLNNLADIWTHLYWRLYIPVTYTFWSILNEVSIAFTQQHTAFNQGIFHLFNISVHAINSVLVFLILNKLVRNNIAAALGALIFVVHPLQVESVVWISELRGLLSTMFGLLLIRIHLNRNDFTDIKSKIFSKNYLIEIVLFSLAILSKPSAIMLPVVLFLFDTLYKQEKPTKLVAYFLPFSIPLIPVSIITLISQPGEELNVIYSPLWVRPFIWADTICFYVFKVIFPYHLATTYGRVNEFLMQQWWFYVEWVLVVAALVLAIRKRKRYPFIILSFLIFVVGYLPLSGLINHAYQSWSNVADRFIYFSVFGIALLVASLLAELKHPKWGYRIVSALILLLTILSFVRQIPTWKNETELWSHSIAINPNDYRGYLCRADVLSEKKDYINAITDYNKGLSLKMDDEGINSRGNTYLAQKEYDLAQKDFEKALQINPKNINAYNNIGTLYTQTSEYNKAIENFNKAIQLSPSDSRPYMNRAMVYNLMNDNIKAKADFITCTKLLPVIEEAYYQLAQIYFKESDFRNVIDCLNHYIGFYPNHADSYLNRAKAHFFIQNYRKALGDAEKARSLGKEVEPAFYNAILSNLKNRQ